MDTISITKKTNSQLDTLGVRSWPIWTCEVSEFPWEYAEKETCLLLEGDVEVNTEEETVRFGTGDFVVFPKGLKCVWEVHEKIKKHYSFI